MRWLLKKQAPDSFCNQFPGYSSLACQLFYDRGIDSQEKINEFFYPDYTADSHNSFLLKDMKKAVSRINKAVKRGEKIAIYGDYDADGVSATAILYDYFQALKIKPVVYLPDRLKEGYGLNNKAIEYLLKKKVRLIITADNGSSNIEEAKFARRKKIDLIITDHHQVVSGRPDVVAFVNPHQKGDNYPFKDLCGTGVVFKLAQALIRSNPKNFLPEGWEKWLLDLVALATVADCVPLLGENRLLVKYGLVVLARTRRPGLRALMKVSSILPGRVETSEIEKESGCIIKEYKVKGLDSYTFGFVLAPRLNAASRMDHANSAFQLLVAAKPEKAEELAKKINKTNRLRQNQVERVLEEVEQRIKNYGKDFMVIFEGGKSWSIGIVGIVAGRLTEKYYKPSFIYEQNSHYAKGSIRSIPEINAVELLKENAGFLETYGGHPMAAGFKVKNEHLADFKKAIEKSVAKKIKGIKLISSLEIDQEINTREINWLIFNEIERFAPYGEKNPRPKLLLRGVEILRKRIIGFNGKHLRLTIKQDNVVLEAIAFNNSWDVEVGDIIDIVFELQANEWQNRRSLELRILDLRKFNNKRISRKVKPRREA